MALEGRIDMWRTRVPSRLDREDPFEGDGFESRPATRLASSLGISLDCRKCKYSDSTPSPEPIPREPVKRNFLFVGSRSSGQTSLLFHHVIAWHANADDQTRAFTRPQYEIYVSDRICNGQPTRIEM
ncbi:hypothetical protein G7Z17_g4634 [Cylindrodendrum hubeiense]|uniref:Uncharacterized protein n=1 Tax=Cylindrodendrum hubeiense TaxID=595255 RepID=A0A9P5HEK0_9HYPO|nr:hypothetical protein G7Z17_g4634 [Cylindrodendrum hubeiense]